MLSNQHTNSIPPSPAKTLCARHQNNIVHICLPTFISTEQDTSRGAPQRYNRAANASLT